MKRLLILLMLVLLASFGFAAMSSYSFGQAAGAYTELASPTTIHGTAIDDGMSAVLNIGFLFKLDGIGYSTFKANSNGFITLNPASSASLTNALATTPLIISPLWDDLKTDDANAGVSYELSGAVGSRILKVQFKNVKWYYSASPVNLANYQIWLYETTNVIEFIYGTIGTGPGTSASASCGISGAVAGNYFSVTPATPTATYSSATEFATIAAAHVPYMAGFKYTFTPPAPVAAPNVATIVSPANAATNVFGTSTLNWVDGGGWTNGFKLYFSPTSSYPPTVLDLGYVTSYDPPGDMAYTTPFSWKVVPYNSFGDNETGTVWTFTTAGAPLSGTKTIDPAGSGTNNYTTFTAAISALNGAGVAPTGVTFTVANGTYAENPVAITTSGTASGRIVFQAAAGANPVVTPAGGALTFGFKLNAADYVTFNNIDVTGPNTLVYGYWLAALTANGATNNIIQNCTITLPYGTSSNYGIYSMGVLDGANSNCTFQGNSIDNFSYGIYLTGSSTAGSEALNLNAQSNVISGVRSYGVYMGYGMNSVIQYNNIGFYAGGTAAYYGVYVLGSTGTYNVHHNTISGGYTSSTVYAMYNSSGNTTYANNEISNVYNTGSSGWYGFYATGGNTTWSNNSIHGIVNTGTAAVYAAYLTTGNHVFNNNSIYDIATGGTSLYGFYVIGGTTHSIYSNKVYNLRYTGILAGIVYGVHVAGGTTNYVYNNMVYDLRATASTAAATAPAIRAFSITSGTTDNIWGNSVYLNSTGTGANFSSAALYVTATTNTIDLKNNIFVNKSTPGAATGKAVAFWKTAAGVGNLSAGSDKNIYYAGVPDATHLIGYFLAASYQTLAEYKTMTAVKDMGSYAEDVPFVSADSPYDLHVRDGNPTRVEGNALIVTYENSAFDIDGEARNAATPDIGADEGVFTPVAGRPGVVTLIGPANNTTGINPNGLTFSWSAPGTGGTPSGYYVFVSPTFTSISNFFLNATTTWVDVPGLSLNVNTWGDINLGFGNHWYWAVQASNTSGESDETDPAFQVWDFTTGAQMSASNTLAIGNAWPLAAKAGTIAITNLGGTALTFTVAGPPEFSFGTLRYTIPANTTSTLPYTFTAPATTGAYTGTITLTQTSPGASSISIAVTANITTDLTIGNGTAELSLPIEPYFGYSYSQTIYYPSELSYPAGYRIEKLYYYFNGFEACPETKQWVIYMGHTTNATFASTAAWEPVAGLTQVYAADNEPQLLAGGYWMEFVLSTPFVYDGVSNLVIAVEENLTGYDSTSSFFFGTVTTGVNRSIRHYSDTINADPAAPPAGTLVAGYPNTKFFVGPIPTTPQITVTPTTWDYGTVVLNSTNSKTVTIQNTGSGTLVINGITPASSGMFALTGTPSYPVSLTTGQTTTFNVRYLPTAAGAHSAIFTIDDNLTDYAVHVNGVCVDPRIVSLPHTQLFDGVTAPALPLGWTGYKANVGATVATSTTYAQSTPNSAYMSNSSYTSDALRVISPQITLPMNTIKLSFYARSSSAGYTMKVGTVSAIDGTGVFTELMSIPLTATFTQYNLSFATYAGTDQYICFQHGQSTTYASLYVDNFVLEQLMATDLAATLLTGPTLATAGTTLTYNVTVYNNGTASQPAYNVHLKIVGGARLATLPVTTPLAPGATAVHSINLTPVSAGNYNICGEVERVADGNSANNETAGKLLSVLSASTYMPLVGDPNSTTTANTLPTNMYWKNGVTETIYTAQEMQMTAGNIFGMAYFNSFTQNLLGKSMKIWVKNTTTADLTTAWLPFSGYTLVFDGVLDFPIGANTVYVPFIAPYAYTGGNFAVRVNRVMDTDYFPATNVFYYTTPQYVIGRSRYIQSDSSLYDPLDPGLGGVGTLINDIPVTAFMVSGATPAVLAAPTNVTATINTTNAVLNWTAVPGAYAYRVFASDTPDSWSTTPLAVVYTNTYNAALGTNAMKFFKIVAVTSYRNENGGNETLPAIIKYDNSGAKALPTVGKTDNKD